LANERSTDRRQAPVAEDPKSRRLLDIARRVAATDVTVTISGESGSGKEVFARYIHNASRRRDEAFVAINCAAIPENMLEALLFGHEKGAFTGAASAHAGKFEQANGGTLLLDEVSEMDLGLQAKLLRVLQEKEVERIGGTRPIKLDVRVLATTNRDLKAYVAEGRFREDLYYRLNVFPLCVPPLRERPGDILPLAEMALGKHRIEPANAVSISDDARLMLEAYRWPGNVRELENLVQRSLILLTGNTIEPADLAFEDDIVASTDDAPDLHSGLRNREYQLIIDALRSMNCRRAEVAESLGISPRTLRYKLARMRESGIPIPGESPAESASREGVHA
jgi:two-component system response regulator FlrC